MAYGFYRTVTIDHTKVPNTDQTDFPVLVAGTYSWLATTTNGGDVTSSSGYDIIFAADAAGTMPLKFEIEKYVATTGEVVFWVKVPSVSHTTDTVFYILYADPAVTTDQSDRANTWNSDFMLVTHMILNGSSQITNSAINSGVSALLYTSGTPATQGTQKIGDGLNFASSGAYSELTPGTRPGSFPVGSSERTLECWFNLPTGRTAGSSMIGYGGNNNYNGQRFQIYYTGNRVYLETRGGAAGRNFTPDSNWHHFAAVLPAGVTTESGILLYLDGSLVTHDSDALTTLNTLSGDAIIIGGLSGAQTAEAFIGQLDEARLSKVARSADWIATGYASQNSPSTFYAFGSATAVRVPVNYDLAATCGMLVGGTAQATVGASMSATVGMRVGGSAMATQDFNLRASGSLVESGSAEVVVDANLHATGDLVFGGQALVAIGSVPPTCVTGDGVVVPVTLGGKSDSVY